ncbi:DUF6573 family protein [Paenibacillus sp. PDC88]|uniref:DUF6573 family protein n=1 Tax=Paenibacillus provencensis TaxID=441151 RepID=A0ABW3Q241_9BACL|nr:DUF6573 family protein [Paenibacillus sp. PDC88]SDX63115.1 hypothetical protein SAMN05518848_11085 [Paenibacillus sp. PDC88]
MSIFENAKVIDTYSRANALADGFLVDVSHLAKEVGIKYPVHMKRNVWDSMIVPDQTAINNGESEKGRLWDCLWMFRIAISNQNGSIVHFKFIATFDGVDRYVSVKAICGPGDNLEPVITILFPDED